jgi:UDP-N-acetylmuramoyl-L-alanyl-D-glutamate--2,6-diaminopimelate ligase
VSARAVRRHLPLSSLLDGVAAVAPAIDCVVSGMTLDSRAVEAGDLFVALAGSQRHGIEFAATAIARGAVAVLVDRPAGTPVVLPTAPGVPLIEVVDLRGKLGRLARRFYGDATSELTLIGVTGTNGKTSTVQLLAQAIDGDDHRAASIGTLGAGMVGQLAAGERTTPDVLSTHELIARFAEHGATHVAMEVSSHALDQGRVDGLDFEIAIFTNLTHDHLDYHGSFAAYGAAKRRLFEWPGLATAIVNLDDPFGRELFAVLRPDIDAVGTSAEGRAQARWRAADIVSDAAGLAFDLIAPTARVRVQTRLLGRFNVANLLGVAAALDALGMPMGRIVERLRQARPVVGRMNRIGGEPGRPLLVVDYAHTPDALEQALSALRAHTAGRLVCVFGCGGERDRAKRPLMAAIAERLADAVIVTDDNPRGEDGDAIVREIVAGLSRPQEVRIERDRAVAIALAVADARGGDTVLIAGKGHEAYQEVAGVKRAFDDVAVARAALERAA